MHTSLKRSIRVVLLSVIAALLIGVGVVAGVGAASAQSKDTGPYHAQDIVNTYLGILDAGMASGSCDFSALSTVYAPDARLTLTGGVFAPGAPAAFLPGGSFDEQQYRGIDAIIGFYTHFCGFFAHTPLGVAHWTQDAAYLLSPNVLNSYERVTFSASPKVGRCMHVFTISSDKIASLDWSVYE
jgi:hypothetical protein